MNTGTVNVTVVGPTSNTDTNYYIGPDQNCFSNTCLLLLNYLPGQLTTGTGDITVGLYIRKPPSTTYAGGVNLSSSGVAHPFANCRLYYSQMILDPQKSLSYVDPLKDGKGFTISENLKKIRVRY